MSQNQVDLLDVLPDEAESLLREHFTARGQPAFRVSQTRGWLYERDALSFGEMTNLPASEREALAERFGLTALEPARVQQARDGTTKHLWKTEDGEFIESVLIPAGKRLTLCISSQAGCAMACTFCATGWSGYRRQLRTGEIIAQFRGARRWARENGLGPVNHIVFMGMGEPLANRRAVMPALTLLNRAYGIGARKITVSTVGLIPGIIELAERPEQFRLAISLHAPNHELREKLIPVEKKYPLPELLDALRRFEALDGRRITFEYIMIRDMNDHLSLAHELADRVGEFNAHVNLIPYNPIPGNDWKPSTPEQIRAFAAILEERGVPTTVRTPRGRDIAAACGQLRAEHETRPPKPFVALTDAGGSASAPARLRP